MAVRAIDQGASERKTPRSWKIPLGILAAVLAVGLALFLLGAIPGSTSASEATLAVVSNEPANQPAVAQKATVPQNQPASPVNLVQLTPQEKTYYVKEGKNFLRAGQLSASQIYGRDSQIVRQLNAFTDFQLNQRLMAPLRIVPEGIQAIQTPQGVQVTTTYRFFATEYKGYPRSEKFVATPRVTFLDRKPVSLQY